MPGEFVAASDRVINDAGEDLSGRSTFYPKRLYAARRMNRRSRP